ncbi:MAG: VTT domain-containing protein [Candidatus Yonathbacteria bacterium]|nr:VTT domain-containing protein [Candidatus Yonathbacteria bacterium]
MLEQSIDVFTQLVQDYRILGYVILFIAMVLEGEVFLIVAGMLASLKAFDVGDVIWISLVGVVLGNIMWYSLGAKLKDAKLTRRILNKAEKIMIYFLPEFRENPFKSIFFSKFIYGANRATVIMSGVLHIPFKLFLKAEFYASIVWVALYFEIGYLFGAAAVGATRKVGHLALMALLFVIVFVVVQKLITRQYERHERKKLGNQ